MKWGAGVAFGTRPTSYFSDSMAFLSRPLTKTSGLLCPCHSILPSKPRGCNDVRLMGCNFIPPLPRVKVLGKRLLSTQHSGTEHIVSARSDRYSERSEDNLPRELFWTSLYRDAIWGLKSLFSFLVEQPSQLKCIEWPSFQSTLKTACLTLIIVALLIVALSLVDSVLCYLLSLAMKRTH